MRIESIAKSIESKRTRKLDDEKFPLNKILLNEYDIRDGNRNVEVMAESLKLNGQKEPLTLNKREDGSVVIVNGRTRFSAMTTILDWIFGKVKFYDGLTELEEDYLNAILNSQQNPLTTDEKRNFIKRHHGKFEKEFGKEAIKEIGRALRLTDGQVKDYLETVQPYVSETVVDLFKQEKKGYGRGEIKIEALAQVVKKVKDEKALKEIGKWHKTSTSTDRILRRQRREIAKRTSKYLNNESLVEKYGTKMIAKKAIEEVTTKTKYNSGESLPKNSENKYPIIDELLKDNYEFAFIGFAESLQRKVGDVYMDSETKRIIDSGIKQIAINGMELDKVSEAEDYAKSKGCEVITYIEDILGTIQKLEPSNRKGLIYLNGAFLWSWRPKFIQTFKELYPNSTIAFVIIDEFSGYSPVSLTDRTKELVTIFAIRKYTYFGEVIHSFKEQMSNYDCEFKKYAEVPQQKYIGIIK